MKNISFDNPYLLLIFIPLLLLIVIPFVIAIRKENINKSAVASLVLHIVIAICVTLALAGITYTTVMTETHVWVVADVSYSANRNLDTVDSYIKELEGKLPKNSKMGVICFGKNYETVTELGEPFVSVKDSGVDDSATDISSALEYASTLFGNEAVNRIVLITDGNQTDTEGMGRLISAVEGIYAKDIYIDAIYLDDNLTDDVKEIQVSDVDFTASAYINHEESADVLVQSSYDTNAIAVLYREGERIENRAVTLTKGYNIINFDLGTSSAGTYSYRVAITADEDLSKTNNTIDFSQNVTADINVLLVSWDEADLERAQALYGSGANIDSYIRNKNVPCSIEELCKYDEIILSSFDVRELNNYTAFIDGIDKAVSLYGKSLVTMGDLRIQNKTDDILKQLEDMLPVKYGNSDQDPKLYAIVIDSSRSMQMFSKLLIAKETAIQLLNLLDDDDYVMIVNFWGEINVLQAPTKASNRAEISRLINDIQPYQGTVIGTALDKAGDLMIDLAFDDKQIMLISDGMSFTLESDTPADIAEKLHDNDITVSVIHPAARPEGTDTLVSIAEAGGGSYFEIVREEDIQDVMFSEIADDVTESVIEGQTPVNIKYPGDPLLSGITALPDVNGYVYAKAKASATTVLTVDFIKSSGNKIEAPLYSYWNYGNGKVSSFTSTFTGEWTDSWSSNTGEALLRNIFTVNVPDEHIDYPYTLSVEYDGTYSELEITPATVDPFASASATVTLPSGKEITQLLTFDSTRFFYKFETPERGKYSVRISYSSNGKDFESTSIFNVSYSPEYNSFAVFDASSLHAAIRNRGTVSEGVVPTLENDSKEVATYTLRFVVPLMIIAISLYVIDVTIRKLKMSDIRSFFRIRSRKGGK